VSEIVLIADADGERGRRIAAACRARGITTSTTTHGAAALEIALAESPVAMVAQVDLPLIDGPKLSEILHANPRTQSMGILFIGDASGTQPANDRAGRVVPGHADPETIAHFVEALLLKRRPPRAGRGAQPKADPGGVEGQLSQIGLMELLELFHVNRKTGLVELRRGRGRRSEIGRVYLRDGDVVQASVGSVAGEKALYRLFAWDRGRFVFRSEEVSIEAEIDRPTRALLREGARHVKEWERLGSELPPKNARVTLRVARASLPSVLHPLTQEVLLTLELCDRVQDVLDRCSYPDYQVLRTLHTLIRRGMVELRQGAPRTEGSGGSLFSAALAARLRDWLDQGRPRSGLTPDAKVLMLASDPAAMRTLVALIERLPGAEMSALALAPAVQLVARLPVDEEFGLELIEAPAVRRFAPIWPLAAHGAAATLFVHSGSPAHSVDALREAFNGVCRLPRARVFHLLLQDKEREERIQALCERLSLYDDRSVFALAPESAEESIPRLREIFAQLLP
jgi:CheY-like chemotaxis protein